MTRRNATVRVPASWVDAVLDIYVKAHKGGPKSVKLYVPIKDLSYYDALKPWLKKAYPYGTLKLRVSVKPGMGSTLGATGRPRPGGSIDVILAAGRKPASARRTIRHELQHVVQYMGDAALAAKIGKKHRGAFGRPTKATTRALRAWKSGVKAKAKATGVKASKAKWYYRSPSEFQPHVTDAAVWVVRKLPASPTDADVRKLIRKALKTRPIFAYLDGPARREAMSQLYAEVARRLEALA